MSNDLTSYEREKLAWLLKTSLSLRAIANLMKRNHGALSREIARNGNCRTTYRADTAQRISEKRKHQRHRGKLDKYPALKQYIEERLNEDWSPEQIAGRLKRNLLPELSGMTISHESIYYYVYEKAEKYLKLYRHLRTSRTKRKKHGKRKGRKVAIPSRISIHERPEIIDTRERYGDWESDTMEFRRMRHNPYLSVQFERKSHLVRIHVMKKKTAEETRGALIKTAESVPPELLKTITFDNGTENMLHTDLQELYDIQTY